MPNASTPRATSSSPRILTNHWGQKTSETWGRVSTFMAPSGRSTGAHWRDARALYRARHDFDCVVLDATRAGLLFALMQAFLPGRRTPALMLNCYWYDYANPLKQMARNALIRAVARGVDRFIVWTTPEIDAYSEAFGLERTMFSMVPYHRTVRKLGPNAFYQVALDAHLEASDEGFLFSGGNSDRDFVTLIEAVRDLDVEVRIATRRPGLPEGFEIPPHVDIRPYTPLEFIQAAAQCRLNVIPIKPGLLRAAGQQTFLNAMIFGKPVIVTDVPGGADYIEDGVDGILTTAGNVEELRDAIRWILDHPEEASEVAERARDTAEAYSTDAHFQGVVAVAEEVLGTRS